MSSKSSKLASHAHQLDQLAECVLAQIRDALIEERVQTGLSHATAENLIDFAWLSRGWPVMCHEQRKNIERWSFN